MQTARRLPESLRVYSKASGPDISDEALLEAIADGDRRAMRTLFTRYSALVYRFVARLTGNESLAEDTVSEVFLDVWRQAYRFEAKSKVSTWVLAIARHKALSALRRRSEVQLDDDMAVTMVDPADGPETMAHNKDRSAIVQKCLRQLSPSHREVIDLVYYHEKSIAEVAQIIGAPANTVKTRMFCARKQIAEMLKRAGVDRVQACG